MKNAGVVTKFVLAEAKPPTGKGVPAAVLF